MGLLFLFSSTLDCFHTWIILFPVVGFTHITGKRSWFPHFRNAFSRRGRKNEKYSDAPRETVFFGFAILALTLSRRFIPGFSEQAGYISGQRHGLFLAALTGLRQRRFLFPPALIALSPCLFIRPPSSRRASLRNVYTRCRAVPVPAGEGLRPFEPRPPGRRFRSGSKL